jgi:SAM-dependent methyltransferase/tetratricopeptide (TPR) repeat protein
MSIRRLTVFLSSTTELAAYRQAIIAHVRPLDAFRCVYMEDFGARDGGSVDVCRQLVAEADVLVGLTGHGRGWEPPGDGRRRSISEMEYDWAAERGLSRLMYVSPDGATGLAPVQSAEAAARQRTFRARVLADNLVDARFYQGHLQDPPELAAAVVGALANLTFRRALRTLQARNDNLDAPMSTASPRPTSLLDRLWRWLAGGAPTAPGGATPPMEVSPLATGFVPPTDPIAALVDLADDPQYAAVVAPPETFDLARLEAEVLARGDARLAQVATERRAASVDFLRLADLTAVHDVDRARLHAARAYDADPTNGLALFRLAELSRRTGQWAEAEAAFDRFDAVAAAEIDPEGAYWAEIAAGDHALAGGDLGRAREAYEGGGALVDAAGDRAAEPAARCRWRLGRAIVDGKLGDLARLDGDLAGADAAYAAGLATLDRLGRDADGPSPGGPSPGASSHGASSPFARDVAVLHVKRGDVARARGALADARAAYDAALALALPRATAAPADVTAQRDLATVHDRIGDIHLAEADRGRALAAYRAGLTIADNLAARDGDVRRDLAISHLKIGDVHLESDDLPAARTAYDAARAILARLAGDRGHAEARRDLAVATAKVGDVRHALGDHVGALAAHRESRTLREALVATDPSNTAWQRDLSVAAERVGDLHLAAGDTTAATVAYRDSLAVRVGLAARDPDNAGWQRDLALAWGRVAATRGAAGDVAGAAASYATARDILVRLHVTAPGLACLADDLAWIDGALATTTRPTDVDTPPADVVAQFGRHAANYVTSPVHAAGESLARLVALAAPEPHWHAVDVATAAGHTALAFAPHVARVTGVDATPEMLAEARTLAAARGITSTAFVPGRAEALPFADASVDLVTCRIAAHHFSDVPRFLAETRRILTSGGRFGLVDNVAPDAELLPAFTAADLAAAEAAYDAFERLRDPSHGRALTVADWRQAVAAAGLTVTHVETLPKRMDFAAWCRRLSVPAATVATLARMLDEAPPAFAAFLRPEIAADGTRTFTLTEVVLIARAR